MEDMPFNFDAQFLKLLREEKERLEKPILNGSCPDHSKYMWYTGQLQGLRLAEQAFNELVEKFNNRAED